MDKQLLIQSAEIDKQVFVLVIGNTEDNFLDCSDTINRSDEKRLEDYFIRLFPHHYEFNHLGLNISTKIMKVYKTLKQHREGSYEDCVKGVDMYSGEMQYIFKQVERKDSSRKVLAAIIVFIYTNIDQHVSIENIKNACYSSIFEKISYHPARLYEDQATIQQLVWKMETQIKELTEKLKKMEEGNNQDKEFSKEMSKERQARVMELESKNIRLFGIAHSYQRRLKQAGLDITYPLDIDKQDPLEGM